MISIKLLCNFIEIALRHGCSRVNLLHIFRIPFLKNTSGWLLLKEISFDWNQKKVEDRERKLVRRIKETYMKYDLSKPS